MNRVYFKVIFHLIAVSFIVFGLVIVHSVFNSRGYYVYGLFIEKGIREIVVFDIGLTLIGMAFFIEFFLTFKPMRIIEGGK